MSLAIAELSPDPALRGVVRRAADFAEIGPPVRRLERPLVGVVLIVSLGPDMTVADRRIGSFVGGLWDRPVSSGHDGEQAGYQLELGLGAAQRLFGAPLAAFANELAPLEDALGAATATELQERIAAASDARSRHAEAQAVLRRTLLAADPDPTPPAVARVIGRLRATRGAARVETLAAEVGWSRRHLAAQVRAATGMSPKALARLIRMEHAVERMLGGASLADVAFEAGFADQPHFNRDFRALVGCAPGEFPFLQDGARAA